MTPEISEFSYGFALTNELVAWIPLAAAPIFPTLIEEGREGGGYDVRLNAPGVPLYLQFKPAECMKRKSAQEISTYRLPLSLPFYRFQITERRKSKQHELLLALEKEKAAVLYAAPRFHALEEINAAWNANEVAGRSIFVSPKAIGRLDENSHHVAFDDRKAFLCSEPKSLSFLSIRGVVEMLGQRLRAEHSPLRDELPRLIAQLLAAETRAMRQIAKRLEFETAAIPIQEQASEGRPTFDTVPVRAGRQLSGAKLQLRQLSDMATTKFNAQIVIVQASSRTVR